VFAAKMVLSPTNQISLSKLYCLQRSSVRCQNCVVCNESKFAAEIVLSTANQSSLPKLCCLQRISV
jgi:hypothetical protein